MSRESVFISRRLSSVTSEGSTTGWLERMCGVVRGLGGINMISLPMSNIVSTMAIQLVEHVRMYPGKLEQLETYLLQKEAEMKAVSDPAELVRCSATIRRVGARNVDGNTEFVLVLGAVREPDAMPGPCTSGGDDSILVLTAPGTVSPLLAVSMAGDDVVVTYSKMPEGASTAGIVRAFGTSALNQNAGACMRSDC